MFPLSYSVIPGILLAVILGSYLLTRKDILYTKGNAVLILYLIFVCEMSYFIFMELAGTERGALWMMIFVFVYSMLQLMLIFYLFEHHFRNVYKFIYPVFSMIAAVIIIILLIVSKDPESSGNTFLLNRTGVFYLRSFSLIPIIMWGLMTLLSSAKKRYYLIFPGLLGTAAAVLCYSSNERCFFTLNIIMILHFLFLPAAVFLDFLRREQYPILPVFDNEEIMNNLPVGIIIVQGKAVYTNRFMRDFLGKDINIREWYDENKGIMDTGSQGDFVKRNLKIAGCDRTVYVRSMKYSEYSYERKAYLLFDYNDNELLERISHRYSEYLSSSISEKILEYHFHMKYHETNEFLKGFAHNAFGMISVIKMGMEYITDSLSKIESKIYASKNLNKDREEIKANYEILENTIKLSEVGVSKLNYALKTLNNRVKMNIESENTVIDLNQFIEQEIFFLINNTLHRYDITMETSYHETKLDVSCNYSMLASVFQNILQFCIDELMLSRKKVISISIGKDNDDVYFRIRNNIHDFDPEKIDSILNSSRFEEEEHYAQLMGALLISKGTNITVKRIQDRELVFEVRLHS